MQDFDFTTSIGCLLVRASQAYERALNAELAARGITFRQSQVLGWLATEGDLSQSDLAERMHLEPPTLVGILDRMERDGWISRHDCLDDRRKKIIRAQSQAEPVWSDIVASMLRLRTRGFGGFGPEKIQSLRDLLSTLLTNLDDGKLKPQS